MADAGSRDRRSCCAAARCCRWTRSAACCPAPTCSSSATGSPPSARALTCRTALVEIDASRRHRHAGHDRHAPAHVADRDARLRRRLDAHPVLRLVLPGVRQALPPAGHPRRQPARRDRGARRRASPPPSTGRTACRPSTTPTPRSTRCRRCPAGSCSPTATSSRHRGSGRPRRSSGDFVAAGCTGDDMLGFQMAFDVTGDPAFPEKAAFEVARELGVPVTTHAGVWGATNDDGIRLMHEHGFMTPEPRLRARRHALRRLLPPDRGHRRLGLGVDGERAERRAGLPAHLGAARARHPGVAVDGHQRVVERRPVLRDAHHARRRPLPRAPRGAREGRDRSPTAACAPSTSSTGRPAAARRRSAATATRAASSRARRPTSC